MNIVVPTRVADQEQEINFVWSKMQAPRGSRRWLAGQVLLYSFGVENTFVLYVFTFTWNYI